MSTEVPRLSPHGVGDAPAVHEGADADEGESASLHPDLWRAMVSETLGIRWYLDLDSMMVIRAPFMDGVPGHPVADDPERFAEVPTLPTDRQRNHARRVLSEHVGLEQASFLTSEEPWLRHFHEHASPELRQVLSDARRAWVITEVRSWLRDHDVPEHRFVRVGRATASREPRSLRSPRGRMTSLREAIHRAVDRMSERELEALPIPARLLVDD